MSDYEYTPDDAEDARGFGQKLAQVGKSMQATGRALSLADSFEHLAESVDMFTERQWVADYIEVGGKWWDVANGCFVIRVDDAPPWDEV